MSNKSAHSNQFMLVNPCYTKLNQGGIKVMTKDLDVLEKGYILLSHVKYELQIFQIQKNRTLPDCSPLTIVNEQLLYVISSGILYSFSVLHLPFPLPEKKKKTFYILFNFPLPEKRKNSIVGNEKRILNFIQRLKHLNLKMPSGLAVSLSIV